MPREPREKALSLEKEKRPLMIDGLEDLPLELLGVTMDSIERSNGRIEIPVELLPYLKICKQTLGACKACGPSASAACSY